MQRVRCCARLSPRPRHWRADVAGVSASRCSDACTTASSHSESATCATLRPAALNKACAADGAEATCAKGLHAGYDDDIDAFALIGISRTKQSSAQDSPVAMHST